MAIPQTKGLQFRSFVKALRSIRGEAAVAATLAVLRPELAEAIRYGTVVTSGWYPLAWYADLHAGAQRALREGAELSRAIAKAGIQDDFRGVYRLVTFVLSPESLFKQAPKVVGLYYDTGLCVIEAAERGFVRGKFLGFAGFDRNLWEDMIGGTTGVMELAGAKQIAPRALSGGHDGDVDMILEVRWAT